ncbi:hypothetical protein ABW19_dt0201330 [Dactylella cylindrospora]|nr:hypothetical protein ABW19_dt0201330 [Dactylella cylindrospora]
MALCGLIRRKPKSLETTSTVSHETSPPNICVTQQQSEQPSPERQSGTEQTSRSSSPTPGSTTDDTNNDSPSDSPNDSSEWHSMIQQLDFRKLRLFRKSRRSGLGQGEINSTAYGGADWKTYAYDPKDYRNYGEVQGGAEPPVSDRMSMGVFGFSYSDAQGGVFTDT